MLTRRIFCALVVLIIAITLPVSAFASAAVINPDFSQTDSDGLPSGWFIDMWVTTPGATEFGVSADGITGNAAHIVSDVYNDARFSQEIEVTPNTVYKFSVMARAKGCDEEETGVNISVEDALGMSEEIHDTDGDWEELVLYGKTGDKQTSLTVMLRLGGYGSLNCGEAWFDDVRIEAVTDAAGATVHSLTPAPRGESGGEAEENTRKYTPLFVMISVLFALAFAWLLRHPAFFEETKTPRIKPQQEESHERLALPAVLGIALLVRVIIGIVVEGYPTDIGCWKGWSLGMASYGPTEFYHIPDYFCDYPPGYMYVLWLIGGIVNLFKMPYDGAGFLLLIKLPAMLADIVCAWLIYRAVKQQSGHTRGLILAAAYAFNPAVIVNSAAWGQIDAILVALLILSINDMTNKRMMRASLIYVAAVLVKPQAIMFGPLLLFAFVQGIIEDGRKGWLELGKCFLAAACVFTLVSLPFFIKTGDPLIIVQKYFGTMASYEYASLSSFNLFGLLGGNWVSQYEVPFLLSWVEWGTILMAITVLGVGFLWWFSHDRRKSLPLLGAVLVLGIFVFGVRMHERYMFPGLALLLVSYSIYRDKRLLWIFGILSVPHFMNVALTLQSEHILEPDAFWLMSGSAINVITMGYLIWVSCDILIRGYVLLGQAPLAREKQEQKQRQSDAPPPFALPTLAESGGGEARFLFKKDLPFMLGLTAVYAVVALVNLGVNKGPESYWQSTNATEEVVFDMGEQTPISRFYYYGFLNDGSFLLSFSQDGEEYTEPRTVKFGDNTMFMWHMEDYDYTMNTETARYVKLEPGRAGLWLFEVAFADSEGRLYSPTVTSLNAREERERSDPHLLLNEQHTVPTVPSYLNSMYFDEIYHARTAYEHINNIEWYETTHPPLGKVFISWGIMLFGMNPLGWRIMGAVAGILMVPVMYALAAFFFRNRKISALLTVLFTFDFMHFSQTRIATIDSYAVLFIMLMYLFMFMYASRSMHHLPLRKTLWPLMLSGVFMGLGVASKWICIYAGIGLAAIFFYTIACRVSEWKRAQKSGKNVPGGMSRAREIAETFPKQLAITLAVCVAFFVAVPIAIYVGSYYQYFRIPMPGHDLAGIWQAQQDMLSYHSRLVDSHYFASPWWEWPLIIRPMWLYMGEHLKSGWVASINTMGSPAVWWAGFAALVWVIWRFVSGRVRGDRRIMLVLLAFAAQFLPWVLVPRSTFIYHYFASVPFILLCCGLYLEQLFVKNKHGFKIALCYAAFAVLLFAAFYPVLSGVAVPIEYARLLRWSPSWTLFSGS